MYNLQVRAELFDWTSDISHGDFDVALACDVLYENFSVEPVAHIAPQLLKPQTGRLFLADPIQRTRENRYHIQIIRFRVAERFSKLFIK